MWNLIYNGTEFQKAGKKRGITHIWLNFWFVKSSFIDKMEFRIFYLEQQQTQPIRIVKMLQTPTVCRKLLPLAQLISNLG